MSTPDTVAAPRALLEAIIRRIRALHEQAERHQETDLDDAWELFFSIDEELTSLIKAPAPALRIALAELPSYVATFVGQGAAAASVDNATFTYLVTASEFEAAKADTALGLDALRDASQAPAEARHWIGPFELTVKPLADDFDLGPGEGYFVTASFQTDDGPGQWSAQFLATDCEGAAAEATRRLKISHPDARKIDLKINAPAGGR